MEGSRREPRRHTSMGMRKQAKPTPLLWSTGRREMTGRKGEEQKHAATGIPAVPCVALLPPCHSLLLFKSSVIEQLQQVLHIVSVMHLVVNLRPGTGRGWMRLPCNFESVKSRCLQTTWRYNSEQAARLS